MSASMKALRARARFLWPSVLALVLVVPLGWLLWLYLSTVKRFAEMQQRVRVTASRLDGRPAERDVIWGETEVGLAFDCYLRACRLCDRVKDSPGVRTAIRAYQSASGSERAILLPRDTASVRPALDALRTGAHRRDPRRQIDWVGETRFLDAVGSFHDLGTVALLQSRAMFRQGRDVDGVRWILDVLQLARDLMDDPGLGILAHGGMLSRNAVAELVEVVYEDVADGQPLRSRIQDLSRPALQELVDGLARLERPFPLPGQRILAAAVIVGSASWDDLQAGVGDNVQLDRWI